MKTKIVWDRDVMSRVGSASPFLVIMIGTWHSGASLNNEVGVVGSARHLSDETILNLYINNLFEIFEFWEHRWILRLENHSLDWLDSRLHLLTIFMIHPCSCFFFSSKAKLTPFLNSKPARTLSSITSLTLSKSSFAEHSIYKSAPMVSAIRSHKSLGAHSLPISEASVSPGEILKSDLQPRKINGMCCVDMHDLWYHPIHCKK